MESVINKHKYPRIDTFLYNGENIVFYRLKYLYDVFDEFVIVESYYTFSGLKKDELFFNKYIDKFMPYIAKITLRVIENFPQDLKYKYKYLKDPNVHEYMYLAYCNCLYQRDYALEYIKYKYIGRNYIVHCSDVDEIPLKDIIKNSNINYELLSSPIYLDLIIFYYNCNWNKRFTRRFSFLCNNRCLLNMSFTYIRNIAPIAEASYYRFAGWHFSYFQTPEEIIFKFKSSIYKNGDEPNPKLFDNEYIKNCIDNGLHLYDFDNNNIHEKLFKFENIRKIELPPNMDELNLN